MITHYAEYLVGIKEVHITHYAEYLVEKKEVPITQA